MYYVHEFTRTLIIDFLEIDLSRGLVLIMGSDGGTIVSNYGDSPSGLFQAELIAMAGTNIIGQFQFIWRSNKQ